MTHFLNWSFFHIGRETIRFHIYDDKFTEVNDQAKKVEKAHKIEFSDFFMETLRIKKQKYKYFLIKFESDDGSFFVKITGSKKTEHKLEKMK